MSARLTPALPRHFDLDRTASRLASERCRLLAGMALVAAVSVAMSMHYRMPGHYGIDDAFITYRYAQNVARGMGFVFNPGSSPVLGTSTPLYTVLLAIGARLGTDIPPFSMVLGAIGMTTSLMLIVAICWSCGQGPAGIAAALLLAAMPVIWSAVEGMETPIYMALILGSLCAAAYSRWPLAFLIAAFAVLTRLDGTAVLFAVMAIAWKERRWSWRDSAPAILLVGGWLLYSWWQFGSPLPASGVAKLAHSVDISGRFLPTLPIMAGLMAGIILRKDRIALLLTCWLAFYLAGMLLLHMPNSLWYYTPATTLGALLLVLFVQRLAGWTLRWCGRPRAERLAAAALGGSAIIFMMASVTFAPPAGMDNSVQLAAYHDAGLWLRDHSQQGDTVVAYETGTIAYLSRLTTIDLLGLTDPTALPFVRKGDFAWAIRERHPTYVFVQEHTMPWPITDAIYALPQFRHHYSIVARWPDRPSQDYLLYRRTQGEVAMKSADLGPGVNVTSIVP